MAEKTENNQRQRLIKYAIGVAAALYPLIAIMAIINYQQDIFWLWLFLAGGCTAWIAAVLTLRKQGRV